jgi:hypothetical protein
MRFRYRFEPAEVADRCASYAFGLLTRAKSSFVYCYTMTLPRSSRIASRSHANTFHGFAGSVSAIRASDVVPYVLVTFVASRRPPERRAVAASRRSMWAKSPSTRGRYRVTFSPPSSVETTEPAASTSGTRSSASDRTNGDWYYSPLPVTLMHQSTQGTYDNTPAITHLAPRRRQARHLQVHPRDVDHGARHGVRAETGSATALRELHREVRSS